MLDAARLRDFINRFYGYGTWNAKLWFVGMEEGGGESPDEIDRRLKAWDGSNDLMDLKVFHDHINLHGRDWFSERPPIQHTWGKLIRTILRAAGRDTNTEAVRQYQRDALGRRDGSTALIELLPLPSPSLNRWTYGDVNVPWLATCDQYRNEILPRREAAIRDQITLRKPTAVVFYGLGYREYWERIAGREFDSVDGERFLTTQNETTRFVLARHPAAKGVRNAEYDAIGRMIRGERVGVRGPTPKGLSQN